MCLPPDEILWEGSTTPVIFLSKCHMSLIMRNQQTTQGTFLKIWAGIVPNVRSQVNEKSRTCYGSRILGSVTMKCRGNSELDSYAIKDTWL